MAKTPVHKLAAAAVNRLRVEAMLEKVPQRVIGEKTGQSRQWINRLLSAKNIKLVDFLAIADAIGSDPAEIIRETYISNENAADSSGGNDK